MPIPFIPIAIAAGIAALAGTTIVIATKNNDKGKQSNKTASKKIALAGGRGVGKTQLITFLSTGKVPETAPQQTTASKQHPSFLYDDPETWKSYQFDPIVDVSGAQDTYAEWRKNIRTADIVLYRVEMHRLNKDDEKHHKRVSMDMQHIGDWLKDIRSAENSTTKEPSVFIIGTHCDLDESFHKENEGDYHDNCSSDRTINTAITHCGGASKVQFIAGSLVDNESAQKVVNTIMKQVQNA